MMVLNQKNAEARRNSNEIKALEESRNKLTNELDRLRTHLVEVKMIFLNLRYPLPKSIKSFKILNYKQKKNYS